MEYLFVVYSDERVDVYHDIKAARLKAHELHRYTNEYEIDKFITIIKQENSYFKIPKPEGLRYENI